MLNHINLKQKMVNLSIIDISKIIIIVFVSVSLLANFVPYYDGADDKLFGITAIYLSEGQYGLTNELFQETDSEIFVPKQWVKTSKDSFIPIGMPGLHVLSAIFYSAFGYYGLFYLGPISAIILLTISERISTKLFGSFAGFITLVILASDWKFFQIGIRLLTDNIFAIFFIIGCFFLIKYFIEKKEKFILLCSIFFVISLFFRISGILFFPIEIFLLGGFFIINYLLEKKNLKLKNMKSKNQKAFGRYSIFNKLKNTKFHKIMVFLFIPWIIFFLFWFSFNSYYFGDPLTNYETERKFVQPEIKEIPEELTEFELDSKQIIQYIREERRNKSFLSFFQFDLERAEWIKFFAVSIIPDNIKFTSTYLSSSDTSTDWHAGNWMSLFSFLILISSLVISLKTKFKRLEVITISLLILGFLWFFSAGFVSPSNLFPPSGGIQERYMISASILSFMLFGYCVDRFRHLSTLNCSFKFLSKFLRGTFIILLLIFLLSCFFIMPPLQDILQSKFHFNNPIDFTERFPLDFEGLDKNSVIVGENGRDTMEYGFIHLNPYIDFSRKLGWSAEKLKLEPIIMLKNIIGNGTEVYAFKKDMSPLDEKYFNYLEQYHNIILKEHSKTFCKIKIIDNSLIDSKKERTSDSKCYSEVNREPNYGWDVRVKPPWETIK